MLPADAMSTEKASSGGSASTGAWGVLAVYAGGAEHLDGVLEDIVAPVMRRVAEERGAPRWRFTRGVDRRGAHLRLAVEGRAAASVAEEIVRWLKPTLAAGDSPRREPVLPAPASRWSGGHVGVEPAEPERASVGDAQAALSHVSSEVVLEALPDLPRGRERVAYGLALARALGEVGLSHDPADFWADEATRLTGERKESRGILARLEGHAQRLGPQLAAEALRLGRTPPTATLLERYVRACEEALEGVVDEDRAALVRKHVHLTSNRLGVNPLEEALLAAVLAGRPAAQGSTDRPAEAVRVDQVSRHTDGRTVLDEVSFTVGEGEVFGLVGPQGAGKSSLLGIAAGLRVMSEGAVRVLDADPAGARRELAGDVAVALPDEELAPQRSVRENLELRARPAGATTDDVLGAIDLRDRSAASVADLEPGERRLVALGCALMTKPRVLLLDEPTRGLSAVERQTVWRMVDDLRKRGTTVVIASTSLQDMLGVCGRAALLLAGSLVDVGRPRELVERHFSPRRVRFATAREPEAAQLRDLPEVQSLHVELRDGGWTIEATALQPDELLTLLGNDPRFPEITWVAAEDLEATFLTHARNLEEPSWT